MNYIDEVVLAEGQSHRGIWLAGRDPVSNEMFVRCYRRGYLGNPDFLVREVRRTPNKTTATFVVRKVRYTFVFQDVAERVVISSRPQDTTAATKIYVNNNLTPEDELAARLDIERVEEECRNGRRCPDCWMPLYSRKVPKGVSSSSSFIYNDQENMFYYVKPGTNQLCCPDCLRR